MKRWGGLALAACLFLSGCGVEHVPEKQEPVQEETAQAEQTQQPTVETIPPVEGAPITPDYADWQTAYAAFLKARVEQAAWVHDPDNPDYDPNWVEMEVNEVIGRYFLYDIDKNDTPELLIRYGGAEASYHTTVYTCADGVVAEVGDIPSGHSSFYTWPGEKAIARNWGHMGGHFVEKISLLDGELRVETVFEEGYAAGGAEVTEYTDMRDIVPGSSYLWETRPYVSRPKMQALTLPVYDYGKDRTAQPIHPDRDALAREKIEEALNGGVFYGVSADGFGGDTGWTILKDYLAPDGVTPYNDFPMEVRETRWLDFNGNGQNEALLTIVGAEADDYEDTKQVIFSWEDEAVYAYCNNYMELYDLTGTVFTGYDVEDFAVAFDGPQFYFYGVEE